MSEAQENQVQEKQVSDHDLAQSILNGTPVPEEKPEAQAEEEKPEAKEPGEAQPEEQAKPEEEQAKPEEEHEKPEEQVAGQEEKPEEKPEEQEVSIENIRDEQLIDLINKKFNVKFDTAQDAEEYFKNQSTYKGQDKIIQTLKEKYKEKANVLSQFPNENAYKAAQLAKSDYPGKYQTLTKIMDSDLEKMSDFDAIRLSEELKRGPSSRVDPLRFKMSKLGLRDLDLNDFNEWDEADKEVVYGEAEDAKRDLAGLQSKVEVPTGEDSETFDFLSEIERGVQQNQEKTNATIEQNTPVAESIVNETGKITFGEDGDFEYEVNLDAESKQELTDFLVSESIEGEYDVSSDVAKKQLKEMLLQEIWATDGPKIMKAYGEYRAQKALEAADEKYENRQPLKGEETPVKQENTKMTDSDYAKRILQK